MAARILLVDDEEAIRTMLKLVLESAGYEVATESCGSAAITRLQREPFDLVLSDMKMESDTAGLEVARAASGRPDAIPVLILTAFPMLAQDWRKAGAAGVLTKPADIQNMFDTIAHLLEQRKTRLNH